MLKHLIKKITFTFIALTLAACGSKQTTDNTIKVGTIAGPETELMETAKKVAKEKFGLNIEIIAFSDYNLPNAALVEGSIDANMFQHIPYLEKQIKDKGYKIVDVGKTFIYPMGIYSKKIKDINQLKEGAVVAIPNDPSNEARALLLLEKAKLIQLNPNAGIHATVTDIRENPMKLKIKEIDAAQLPRALPDVDLALINTNFAMIAGLLPSKDALEIESAENSPYANLVATRVGMENDPRVKQLVEALQSIPVQEKAQDLFKGQAIPAWKAAQ